MIPARESLIRATVGGREFTLIAPERPDDVVRTAERAGADDRGYWAHLWPSAVTLAEWVATTSLLAPGSRVLEIGCGLGLVSLAAAARGCEVTATDVNIEALSVLARSAAAHHLSVRTARLDWRDPPPSDLEADMILGADVLYDPRDHAPIARLIARLNSPACLTDPMRANSVGFESAAERESLRVWQTRTDSGRLLLVQPGGS